MSATNLLIGNLSDVGTTQYQPLGLLYTEPADFGSDRDTGTAGTTRSGSRTWIYVYNGTAGTLAAGTVVSRAAGASTYSVRACPASSNPMAAVGVVVTAIPTLNYGWVVREGLVEVTADDTTAITANSALTIGTGGVAGRAQPVAAATGAAFAVATELAAVNVNALCMVSCRG
jgi:hypothetical protein